MNRGRIVPPERRPVRLIDRVDVLSALLAEIASVPAKKPLVFEDLRDRMIRRDEIGKGIQTLIAANELDPVTLRPFSVEAGEA